MDSAKALVFYPNPPELEFQHEYDARCPWSILGLKPGSSDADIKKAFKFLSMKCHPDLVPGLEEFFLLLNQAQQVLLDPVRRKLFDEYGVFRTSPSEDKIGRLARAEIAAIFVKVYDANAGVADKKKNAKWVVTHIDLMRVTRESLQGSLRAAKKAITEAEKEIDTIKEAGRRFTVVVDNEPNQVVKANVRKRLTVKINKIADNIETFRVNCLVFRKAIELCDDFEYKHEEDEEQAIRFELQDMSIR